MTPKEKAKYLVDKMYIDLRPFSQYGEYGIEQAKQCALIAVEFAIEFAGGDMNEKFDKILYLVEVKHEIAKL